MTPAKNNILVKFDPVPSIGGIIIPERYKIQEGDEEDNDAYGVTTNRKAINPQVVTIVKSKSGSLDGRRAFVYYGAYEIAHWPEPELAIIPEHTILFFIDPIEPYDGTYLGEEVFTDGVKTKSGIYITPYAEKKEPVMIRVTHIPQHGGVQYGGKYIQPGDVVVTVDSYQYDLHFREKKYIKLKSPEIIGVQTSDGYVPTGDRVLIEYLPDADLLERIAENDKRKEQLEIASKYHLHIGDMPGGELPEHLKPVKEPKTVQAKLLAIADSVNLKTLIGHISVGDEVMVFRNYGCILPNGQWLTPVDNVIGIMV